MTNGLASTTHHRVSIVLTNRRSVTVYALSTAPEQFGLSVMIHLYESLSSGSGYKAFILVLWTNNFIWDELWVYNITTHSIGNNHAVLLVFSPFFDRTNC